MTTPAVITLPLSTFENMHMEQTWRIDDCKHQAKQAWEFLANYKSYLASDGFPQTSFCLTLLETYQNILANHHQNVELLWILRPFLWWWWLPFYYSSWIISPSSWPWHEPRCFRGVFTFPFVYHFIMKLSLYFSESWTHSPQLDMTLDQTTSPFWHSLCFNIEHMSTSLESLWNLKGVMLQFFPLLQFLPFTKEPLCNCGSVYYFILLSKGIESSGWIMTHHLKIYDKICFQLYKPVGDN